MKGILWMLSGRGVSIFTQFFYFILLTRSLGVEGYGQFSAVTSFASIAFPFSGLGSGDLLIRSISREKISFNKAWGKALLITLSSTIILVLILLSISHFILPKTISLWTMLFIYLSDTLCLSTVQQIGGALIASGLYKISALLDVLYTVSKLLAAIIFFIAFQEHSTEAWAFLYFLFATISTLAGIIVIVHTLGFPRFSFSTVMKDVDEGIHFSFGGFAESLLGGIPTTMLASLSTLEATGLYSAAWRFIAMAEVPMLTLGGVSYPKFFTAGVAGIAGTIKLAKRLIPIVCIYGIIAFVGFLCFSSLIPHFLGNQYTASIQVIYWLAPIPLLGGLMWIAADTLSGAGYQKSRGMINTVSVLVSVSLNYYLISRYSWRGAAWALVISGALRFLFLWGYALFLQHKQMQKSKVH